MHSRHVLTASCLRCTLQYSSAAAACTVSVARGVWCVLVAAGGGGSGGGGGKPGTPRPAIKATRPDDAWQVQPRSNYYLKAQLAQAGYRAAASLLAGGHARGRGSAETQFNLLGRCAEGGGDGITGIWVLRHRRAGHSGHYQMRHLAICHASLSAHSCIYRTTSGSRPADLLCARSLVCVFDSLVATGISLGASRPLRSAKGVSPYSRAL